MSSTKVKSIPFSSKTPYQYNWDRPIKNKQKFVNNIHWFGRFLINHEFESIEVHGVENYPKEGKCLVVSNHVNGMDPITIHMSAGKGTTRTGYFMCKSEFFQAFYFRWILDLFNGFPINREKPDRDSLNFAIKVLEAGELLTIFPEGTRDRYRTRPKLENSKTGFAMIAREAKAPVLPVSIHLSSDLENKHPKCIIRYGEVIPYEELGFTEGSRKASELKSVANNIMTKVQELWDMDQI